MYIMHDTINNSRLYVFNDYITALNVQSILAKLGIETSIEIML